MPIPRLEPNRDGGMDKDRRSGRYTLYSTARKIARERDRLQGTLRMRPVPYADITCSCGTKVRATPPPNGGFQFVCGCGRPMLIMATA